MLHRYSKEDLIEAIKNDSQIDMFGMETTWINALKRAKKPKMATGGNVNNYPSFEVTKTIRVDDMMITPGYYTYTGRENGGKGVYLNVHTKQTLGFDLDMLKSLNEKHPTDIQILMKKGGRVKKGNYSYIPQEEIDYLVTEYGKKIDGNKLLDGAYAKGNTKAPKITRTQFEEEDYEFAKGGEISVYNLRKGDRVKTRKGDIETIIKKTGSGSYETIENDYTHSPESLEFVSRPGRKMATGGSMGSRVNYQNDDFALVMLGGSIGSKTSLPIFVNGKMGSIVESGNNKEMLKEKAARMRKQLSAGERKHYGMSYTVVALTPAKIKEIERFKNK